MRLIEITRPSFYEEAIEVLERAGYKKLGSGVYGTAFQRKSRPNEIIKLFSQNDEAYMAYVEFILENQDNPHFPKIIGKPMEITSDYYAVKMEKLEPVSRDTFDRKFYNGLEQYLNGYDVTDSFTEAYIDAHPKFKEALDKLSNFKNQTHYEWDFHAGNIMWRNKTLVILDPLFWDM